MRHSSALTIGQLMWASSMQIILRHHPRRPVGTYRRRVARTAKRSRAQSLWHAAAAAARSLTVIGSWYLTVTVR